MPEAQVGAARGGREIMLRRERGVGKGARQSPPTLHFAAHMELLSNRHGPSPYWPASLAARRSASATE